MTAFICGRNSKENGEMRSLDRSERIQFIAWKCGDIFNTLLSMQHIYVQQSNNINLSFWWQTFPPLPAGEVTMCEEDDARGFFPLLTFTFLPLNIVETG